MLPDAMFVVPLAYRRGGGEGQHCDPRVEGLEEVRVLGQGYRGRVINQRYRGCLVRRRRLGGKAEW
jgi:hypothetical protein